MPNCSNITHNSLTAGAPPQTPLGELTTLHQATSRFLGAFGTSILQPFRAFGAQLQCPLTVFKYKYHPVQIA